MLAWPASTTGSIITVGDDGFRYFNEAENNRHGHIYKSGEWRNSYVCAHPYLVFDETKLKEIEAAPKPIADFDQRLIKADSLADLAKKIDMPAENLEKAVKTFNEFAKNGCDYQFGRDPETMRAFDDGPYYAIAMSHAVLNTQGGPERNEKAEVLNANNEPIPHLYGAGELGGISANQYQGGNNLAECLIWGKIAGDQSSQNKDDIATDTSEKMNKINDLIAGERQNITVGKDQYLGSSDKGMGGRITTRVTYKDHKIDRVEIVESHESEDIAKEALTEMPEKIVKANSTDVDVVSGASLTSRAIKEAVNKAIDQAN